MIKSCSFLPAATQMIYDMGLQHKLNGVTFECSVESRKKQPIVVNCLLEGKNYSSAEIDRIFSVSKAQGKSLYYVNDTLLQQIAPDVIFTQDVCEVCQIDTACTATAIAKLKKQPELITLTPQSLEDVFETAIIIAKALGEEEAAYVYLAGLRHRIDLLIDRQRAAKVLPKRVMLMEWVEPIYNCGHWIPHQIAWAGGIDMLSNPSGDSIVTSWDKIRLYNPEVLVIAPCGFEVKRTLEDIRILYDKPGWEQLDAVKNNKVFIADYDMFTQPSPGTLTNGIELLAGIFHPEVCPVPEHLKSKYLHLNQKINEMA